MTLKVKPTKQLTGKPADKRKIELTRNRTRVPVRKQLALTKTDDLSSKEVERLIYELRTHQMELEIQNEELRDTQIALEETKCRYGDLYDMAPVGYFTLDANGVIIESNLTGASMLGVERSKLLKIPFTRFISRESQDTFYIHHRSVIETGEHQVCELELKRKDGAVFYASLDSELGQRKRCRTVISDITSRRRVEAALRDSEERYKSIFEGANDGIIACDLKTGRFLFVNRRMSEITGYSTEEILKLAVKDLHPPGDRTWVLKEFDKIAAGEKKEAKDVPVLKKDGRIVYCDIGSSFAGKTVLYGFFRDVTDRKRSREALVASADRYRSYIDVTEQLGWTTNAKGEVVEDLPSWMRFTGQTFEEMKGWGWADAIHGDDIERATRIWRKAIAEKSKYEVEYRVRRKDGVYRHFLARGVPVLEGDDIIREWVGTCIDITEHKQAEDALRRAYDEQEIRISERTADLIAINRQLEAEIAERKAVEEALRASGKQLRRLSLEIFSAEEKERRRISRELHDQVAQDLSLLKLQTRIVQRGLGEEQNAVREESEGILRNIDVVIENIRRLSRNLSPSALDELGLMAAIRGLANNISNTYGIKVTTDVADIDAVFPRALQTGVYRVLQEALTNAGKHAGAKNASVVVRKDDDSVTFSVEDDGAGFNVGKVMSKEVEKGMGLSIMRERVEMMEGSFDLWSDKGKGTKITIVIPFGKEDR